MARIAFYVVFLGVALVWILFLVPAGATPNELVLVPEGVLRYANAVRDSSVDLRFRIENRGSESWDLKVVGKSCGCFNVEPEQFGLRPGAGREVVVNVYVPFSGQRDGVVVMEAQAAEQQAQLPLRFDIRARAAPHMEIAPKAIPINVIASSGSCVLSVSIPGKTVPTRYSITGMQGNRVDDVRYEVLVPWERVGDRVGATLRVEADGVSEYDSLRVFAETSAGSYRAEAMIGR